MTNFDSLVSTIHETHFTLQQSAAKAINKHLTIRNWLIGFYIVEFEQNGEDRARYGEKLLIRLADSLNLESLSHRNLRLYRQFYIVYRELGQMIKRELFRLGVDSRLVFQLTDNEKDGIWQQAIAKSDDESFEYQSNLLAKLSYTHLVQLLPIAELSKRRFYENQCIKSNWSVAELKRQINTLYYERSGMSLNPAALAEEVDENAQRWACCW